MTYLKQNKGFTLVELAIVIVIIGFLVAGIAAGANMITSRASLYDYRPSTISGSL